MRLQYFIIMFIFIISCNQNNSADRYASNYETENMSEQEKFDTTKLTETDLKILKNFAVKRTMYNKYIKENKLKLYTCPGCGYPTLSERGEYSICVICYWEDDGQDNEQANEVWGGPNQRLTLTENRLNIGKILQHLADSLGGKINANPDDFMIALENHNERMNSFNDNEMMDALRGDAIWKKWDEQSKIILTELIKK